MRGLIPIAGALVLGLAFVPTLSALRTTRSLPYRSWDGRAEFALEIPRTWEPMGSPHLLTGPLPSGVSASLRLEGYAGSSPPAPYADAAPSLTGNPERSEVTWAEGGWRRSLSTNRLRSPDGSTSPLRVFTGRMERPDAVFTAVVAVMGIPTEEDCELLDRCLLSMRAIGR